MSTQKRTRPGSFAGRKSAKQRNTQSEAVLQTIATSCSQRQSQNTNQKQQLEVHQALVYDQIERGHAVSCVEIISTHTALVSDLQRDNEMLRKENEFLRLQMGECQKSKALIQSEMAEATQYMAQLEDKVYKSNKTSLDLLTNLRDREVELATLKSYVIDLKARIAIYIPVKDCPIDKKLAEYINNYPDRQKLKIMFMRETQGVYEFGSKRVMVKVERDKIQIKVGGGYLSIDEFLDIYTPDELAKLERRDPLKKFSEKVAIQKTIGDRLGVKLAPDRMISPTNGKNRA